MITFTAEYTATFAGEPNSKEPATMNSHEIEQLQRTVDALVTWRTLGPTMHTLMHEHVLRTLASVDREQERTTRVTPSARASAQAVDVAMHYRRMLRDYHA